MGSCTNFITRVFHLHADLSEGAVPLLVAGVISQAKRVVQLTGNLGVLSVQLGQIRNDVHLSPGTGGKVHVISDLAELNGEYSKIAGELHNTFSLAYYSSNEKRDGTLRKIRVEVKNPGYKVRTRSHYFVPRED